MKIKFKSNLKVYMAQNDIDTQDEIIKRSGLSKPTVSKIFKNQLDKVSIKTIEKLCNNLSCRFEDIVLVEYEE